MRSAAGCSRESSRRGAPLPLLRPDLLIPDVLMPGLSGFEVLDEVRRYYPGKLPVVLLSALDSDATIAEGKRHGAPGYLAKPCVPARRRPEAEKENVPGWTVRRCSGPGVDHE